jgi:hypothetical protein
LNQLVLRLVLLQHPTGGGKINSAIELVTKNLKKRSSLTEHRIGKKRLTQCSAHGVSTQTLQKDDCHHLPHLAHHSHNYRDHLVGTALAPVRST